MDQFLPGVGPQPGTWHFDPLHSNLIFIAHYLRYGRVQGAFADAEGRIEVGHDRAANSSVDLVIQAASVTTGVAARDRHLRSPEFLDTERHPDIRFVSTGLDLNRRGRFRFLLHGDLTIRGKPAPVTLDAQWVGESPDHTDPDRVHGHFFAAHTRINRGDFGLGDGGTAPLGGPVVGEHIDIVLEVRLQNRDPTPLLKRIGHIS
jgi:polyisoprenoid-binding protein YceI